MGTYGLIESPPLRLIRSPLRLIKYRVRPLAPYGLLGPASKVLTDGMVSWLVREQVGAKRDKLTLLGLRGVN